MCLLVGDQCDASKLTLHLALTCRLVPNVKQAAKYIVYLYYLRVEESVIRVSYVCIS